MSRFRRYMPASIAVLFASCRPAPPAVPVPRVVVLVSIDTLRADAVSIDPRAGIQTPFLASLAAEGVTFRRAYAPSSWTPPTMASLFTSLDPLAHGVRYGVLDQGLVATQPALAGDLVTVAEAFKTAGWKTVGVPSNIHLASRLGFSQGFDRYGPADTFLSAEKVNEGAIALLDEEFGSAGPAREHLSHVFLWLHYFDPHDPYAARRPWIKTLDPSYDENPVRYPSEATRKDLKDRVALEGAAFTSCLWPLYLSEVGFTDAKMRELLKGLGLLSDDVLIVVTADHGEEIGDHGDLGHGHTLYEELLRIPLIVRWPQGLPRGVVRNEMVSSLDVFPTLADLAGLPAPAGVLGQSLRAGIDGTPPAPRSFFFSLFTPQPDLRGVREGNWKLIEDTSGSRPSMLFDIAADPAELHDLAAGNPDTVSRMEAMIDRWNREQPHREAPPVNVDEETKKRLEAIGYIGH
ncbi:MAG: sulfatase [Acidobacteriota bacterium]